MTRGNEISLLLTNAIAARDYSTKSDMIRHVRSM